MPGSRLVGGTAPGRNLEGVGKVGMLRGASAISGLLGAAKLQSSLGADNPH